MGDDAGLVPCRSSQRFLRLLLFCSLLLLKMPALAAFAVELPAERPYVLAVVPQLPPVTMHVNWTPLVQRLEKDTGLRFSLKVYDSMDRFEEDFMHGGPDFVYTNPTQTVLARRVQGYVPLVRDSRPLAGYLFVRKDSPIKTAGELQGKSVAFVGSKNL